MCFLSSWNNFYHYHIYGELLCNISNLIIWQLNTIIIKNNERSLNMAAILTLKFPMSKKWTPSGVCCRRGKVDFLYNSVIIKIEPHFKAIRPEIKLLSTKNGVPFACEFDNRSFPDISRVCSPNLVPKCSALFEKVRGREISGLCY